MYIDGIKFEERIAIFEKKLIIAALRDSGGRQKSAAELLKMTNRIFTYKISKYGIDCGLFKSK